MPLLDRHRVSKLIELTALERTIAGPERTLRESDVAMLIKAAYDDAVDTARAAFMARVQSMPTSAWPWSAVQAAAPAARPPLGVRPRGGGAPGLGGPNALGVPPVPATPALLILLRGQAETADADPGNAIPARGTPDGTAWEGLQAALDRWDTAVIRRYIRPQGWVIPGAAGPRESQDDGATSGPPAPTPGTSPDLPATTTEAAVPFWKQPAVLVVGATVVVATGATVYALTRDSAGQRLEAELRRVAAEARKQ